MIRVTGTDSQTRTYTFAVTKTGEKYLADIALLRLPRADADRFPAAGSAETTPTFGGKP